MGRGERPSRLPWVAAWLLLWAVVPAGSAERAGASETDLVQRIFSALDVGAEIAAVAPIATGQIASAPGAPLADRVVLGRVIRAGFAAGVLERLALEAFQARFDRARAAEAVRWLARPEIQRLYAAGRAISERCEPGGEAVSGPRARALARIRAATSVEARARGHSTGVFGAMLRAGNDALPETCSYSRVELADMIVAQRAALPAPSAGQGCQYRDFSTRSLLSAQAFLESETGRWLHASVSAAVEEALSRAARATALRVVDRFGDSDPRRAPLRIARTRAAG